MELPLTQPFDLLEQSQLLLALLLFDPGIELHCERQQAVGGHDPAYQDTHVARHVGVLVRVEQQRFVQVVAVLYRHHVSITIKFRTQVEWVVCGGDVRHHPEKHPHRNQVRFGGLQKNAYVLVDTAERREDQVRHEPEDEEPHLVWVRRVYVDLEENLHQRVPEPEHQEGYLRRDQPERQKRAVFELRRDFVVVRLEKRKL
ncbi:hypothetical protein KL909_004115 [Ogataea angusta]|nr:hypothetical protein KL909_004115 [Ogataea angusta]